MGPGAVREILLSREKVQIERALAKQVREEKPKKLTKQRKLNKNRFKATQEISVKSQRKIKPTENTL